MLHRSDHGCDVVGGTGAEEDDAAGNALIAGREQANVLINRNARYEYKIIVNYSFLVTSNRPKCP